MRPDGYALDIVVPCYMEEDALPHTIPTLGAYIESLRGHRGFATVRYLLVDDGSSDRTWNVIDDLSQSSPESIVGIRLSRNFGHQSAMLAGLAHADADAVLTIDADLQDDITAIDRMLEQFESGFNMVLGVRSARSADTPFKRNTAQAFYRIMAWLGVEIVRDHADFRLLSRRALQALLSFGEVNLFFRGIVASVGFRPVIVHYERKARAQGTTKYTLRKMLGLAANGVTSFSITPLRIVAVTGFAISAVSAFMLIWVLAQKLFYPAQTFPGWASTLLPLLLLGGIQVFSTGVLGEYIGKIYLETKCLVPAFSGAD